MVETRLIAGDAGVDFVGASRGGLADKRRIGQQRTRQRYHVGATVSENLFGDFRRVDTVGRNQRNADFALHLFGDPSKSPARNRRGDGGHPRFVPADAGIDQRRARGLNRPGQLDDFFPTAAVGNQVYHRQPVNDDEIGPHGLPGAGDDLDWQAHPVRIAPSPLVVAAVGFPDQEFVDEVAFRAHDFDTVVARLAGELGAADEGLDLPLHAGGREFARPEG
jgi:hypothetical protein